VDYFPAYEGPKQHEIEGRNFLASLFQDMFLGCENITKERQIFIHFTCATDTENIDKIYKSLKETILGNNIAELNL